MAAATKTGRATVARGRSVVVEGKTRGPGAEVELPEDEVARLRGIGFLVDPKAEGPPVAQGPSFGQENGRITAV